MTNQKINFSKSVAARREQEAREMADMLRKRSARKSSVNDLTNMVNVDDINVFIEKQIKEFERDLRADLKGEIEDVLATARKQVIEVRSPNKVTQIEGLTHFQMPQLLRMVSTRSKFDGHRKNILLTGPMGGGKSTACKKVAEALGLSFGYIGQTNMPHLVVGSRDPLNHEVFRHTAFTDAFINGGKIVFEEVDGWNPNASLVLNAPLANGWLTLEDGKTYERHPDCVIVACANTWGTGATAQYVGRNKLDDAFLDRFIKMEWKYDNNLERAAAGNDLIVDIVQTARYNAQVNGIKVNISPRVSFNMVDLVENGFSIDEAMDMTFLAGVDSDVRTRLLDGVDY